MQEDSEILRKLRSPRRGGPPPAPHLLPSKAKSERPAPSITATSARVPQQAGTVKQAKFHPSPRSARGILRGRQGSRAPASEGPNGATLRLRVRHWPSMRWWPSQDGLIVQSADLVVVQPGGMKGFSSKSLALCPQHDRVSAEARVHPSIFDCGLPAIETLQVLAASTAAVKAALGKHQA